MIRLLTIIALILLAGCDGGGLVDARGRDAKAIACGVLATATLDVPPTPGPAPKPNPGPQKCENCNGKGRVGDGRITIDCPVCGGDGVK